MVLAEGAGPAELAQSLELWRQLAHGESTLNKPRANALTALHAMGNSTTPSFSCSYAVIAIRQLLDERIFFRVRSMGERLRNTKHERFARAVAALTPLATAYREAGFSGDPTWHPFNASRLAHTPKVKSRIEELRLEFEAMSAIHVDYVRHLLLRTVEADARDLYEKDPDDPTGKRRRLRSIEKLPRHLASAISRIKLDPESGLPVDVILGNKNEAAATLLRSLPGGNSVPQSVEVQWKDPEYPTTITRIIVNPENHDGPLVGEQVDVDQAAARIAALVRSKNDEAPK
jgi:hypothetical protein